MGNIQYYKLLKRKIQLWSRNSPTFFPCTFSASMYYFSLFAWYYSCQLTHFCQIACTSDRLIQSLACTISKENNLCTWDNKSWALKLLCHSQEIISFGTVPTRHNLTQKLTPGLLLCLVGVCVLKICICVGSAQCLPWVCSGSAPFGVCFMHWSVK